MVFRLAPNAGEITAVIGPNGAGKTTLFNCITGFYKPASGAIVSNDIMLQGKSSSWICRNARIARTFQNLRLFGGLSVLENLMVAQNTKLMQASKFGIAALIGTRAWKQSHGEALDRTRGLLYSVGLVAVADAQADSLPYGDRRRLEIARALATDPLLLCLDEPAAGLNPAESAALNTLLRDICDTRKVSILLIEHDMSVVMNISNRIVVLDHGAKIAEGTPAAIKCDARVIEAYLGS